MSYFLFVLCFFVLIAKGFAVSSDYRELASLDGLVSYVNVYERNPGKKTLVVVSDNDKAFYGAPLNLQKLLQHSCQILNARHQSISPSTELIIFGLNQDEKIYVGKGAFDGALKLEEVFELYGEIEKTDFLPDSVAGILTLSRNKKLQRDKTGISIERLDSAFEKRAEAMTESALNDLKQTLASVSGTEAEALKKIDDICDRLYSAIRFLGVKGVSGRFKQVEGLENQKRLELVFDSIRSSLDSFVPQSLDALLLHEDNYSEYAELFKSCGLTDAEKLLVELNESKVSSTLQSNDFKATFVAELQVSPISKDAVGELNEYGLILEEYSSRYADLGQYVEAVQGRMGEIMVSYFEQLSVQLNSLGEVVFDIPALLEIEEQEVSWFIEWEAYDLALETELAFALRVTDLIDDGLNQYQSQISELAPEHASLDSLELDLGFFREFEEQFVGINSYTLASEKRISEIIREVEQVTIDRLELSESDLKTRVDISGHQISLLQCAKYLEENGHSLIAIGRTESSGSGAHKLLHHFGWVDSEKSVSSLVIKTSGGEQFTFSMAFAGSDESVFIPDEIESGDSIEDIHSNEWTAVAINLDLVRPNAKRGLNGATDSDRFSADPNDPLRVVEYGVFDSEMHTEIAVQASLAAIEEYPDEGRYYFNMGRALFVAGEMEDASDFFKIALENGYKTANHFLAEIAIYPVFNLDPNQVDMPITRLRQAKAYYAKSAEIEYPGAAEQITMVSDMLSGYRPDFSGSGMVSFEFIQNVYDNNLPWLIDSFEKRSGSERKDRYYSCYAYLSIMARKLAARHGISSTSPSYQQITSTEPSSYASAMNKLYNIVSDLNGFRMIGTLLLGSGMTSEENKWKVKALDYGESVEHDIDILDFSLQGDAGEAERIISNIANFIRYILENEG